MIKLLDANYDSEDGTSYAKIMTDCGIFEDWAFLHPDDKEIASKFLGCEIAEYRATLLYFHKKLSLLNKLSITIPVISSNFEMYSVISALISGLISLPSS